MPGTWNANYQSGVDGKKCNSDVPWNGNHQSGVAGRKSTGSMKKGGRARNTKKMGGSGPRTKGSY